MADNNNSELLALMGDLIRATDRQTEVFTQRFERLNEVMVDGFGRLEGKIGETNVRLDHLTERVDHLTEEVQEIKVDIREIKAGAQETNSRLANTFEQTGRLTENTDAVGLRLIHVEQAQQPTNAELDARLKVVEAQLRSAS